MNQKKNDMKKYLTAREREMTKTELAELTTALQELIDRETETCLKMERLQRQLGNYKGAFLIYELNDRRRFLNLLFEKRKQLMSP
jgi:hypothetical protein